MAKMMKRKKFFAILMTLVLLTGLIAIPAQAASSSKSVDHIDIGVSLTANVKIDGVLYENLHYTLQKSDITGSNLTITSNGPAFTYNINNIGTSTGSSGISQFRISGNFPVTDSQGNAVTYTVELKKTITVTTNAGDEVTIPVKFVASFDYWDSHNDCPGLDHSKNSWSSGSVIGNSGMDFLLGNADSDTNTKGTITIQKTLAGLEIAEGDVQDFVFDVYNSSNTLVSSVTAHVESGSPYATVSVSELPFGTYYIVEQAANVDGYTYTTSYHIESNAETSGKSEAFTLSSTEPVVHAYVTNTYTAIPQSTYSDITVEKVWLNDTESLRPDSVLVQLYENGDASGEPVTLSADNDWTYTWAQLDDASTWTVDELDVPEGYIKEITLNDGRFTITNTHSDPRAGMAYVSVTKVWDDNDYPDRPAEVTVQLLLNGEPEGESVVLNADNNWSHKWYRLNPDMEWSIAEVNVAEGYTSTITQDGLYFTVTNSMDYTPPTTEPPITEPPATEPPATEPPTTEPPTTEPPADDPVPLDDDFPVALDDDVPVDETDSDKADVPYTGAATGIWAAMSLLSGAGLAGLALTKKKKR